jgi:hypothetical protein
MRLKVRLVPEYARLLEVSSRRSRSHILAHDAVRPCWQLELAGRRMATHGVGLAAIGAKQGSKRSVVAAASTHCRPARFRSMTWSIVVGPQVVAMLWRRCTRRKGRVVVG